MVSSRNSSSWGLHRHYPAPGNDPSAYSRTIYAEMPKGCLRREPLRFFASTVYETALITPHESHNSGELYDFLHIIPGIFHKEFLK